MNNLVIKKFKGCGACELCKENIDCKKIHVPVKITFMEDQKADNWGHLVTVFEKDEIVQGRAAIKDNQVYCASAKSNIYEGYEDFIELENVKIERKPAFINEDFEKAVQDMIQGSEKKGSC